MGKLKKKFHKGYRYKTWQQQVLHDGGYKCSQCGSTDKLTADHIKPVVNHSELRYDVNNGRILCDKCRVKDMLNSLENGVFKTG